MRHSYNITTVPYSYFKSKEGILMLLNGIFK